MYFVYVKMWTYFKKKYIILPVKSTDRENIFL